MEQYRRLWLELEIALLDLYVALSKAGYENEARLAWAEYKSVQVKSFDDRIELEETQEYNDVRKYRESQLRQPKGAPTGGQWVKEDTRATKVVTPTLEVHGRYSTPKNKVAPYSIIDSYGEKDNVQGRDFYDEDGWLLKQLHTNNHGKPKAHPFGKQGEHAHIYRWDKDTGKLLERTIGEVSDDDRECNKIFND